MDFLLDKGSVSHNEAVKKAECEYEKYKVIQDRLYQSDFDRLLFETSKIKKESKENKNRK